MKEHRQGHDDEQLDRHVGRSAPGRRTLTMGLSAGAAQASAAADSDRGWSAVRPREDIAELMDQGLRPDLWSRPAQARMSASELGAASTTGSPSSTSLPVQLRASMERSFGADFGSVQVTRDDPAVAAMGAQAFARGDDLHFAPGHYQPDSAAGTELIGHELAHVVQQRDGRVSMGQAKGGVVADAGLEREADELGARAARGEIVRAGGGGSSYGSGAMQARMEARDLRNGLRVWALVGGTRYHKLADVTDVALEAQTATVRFVQSGTSETVDFNDLYAQDSDELEPYTTADTVRDTAARLGRKIGSGKVVSDTANTLGVVSGTTSLIAESAHQEALYQVGIVGGFGVALGGVTQILRALCTTKDAKDKLVLAAQGILNMASGTLGAVAGFMGLGGASHTSTWTGVGSLICWEAVEAINVLANADQALADLAECNVTYTLASVLCSCFKLLGGTAMALAGAFSSQPLLIAGMVAAGIGTVGSVITGVVKLIKMCAHHYTHNQPVGGGAPDVVSDMPAIGGAVDPRADHADRKDDRKDDDPPPLEIVIHSQPPTASASGSNELS